MENMKVIEIEYSRNNGLIWMEEDDKILDSFFLVSPLGTWGVFWTPPFPMKISVKKHCGKSLEMGFWDQGSERWSCNDGKGFPRLFSFRNTKHFRLEDGDIIVLQSI